LDPQIPYPEKELCEAGMMITILFDQVLTDCVVVEIASSEGIEVACPYGATRKIADALIAAGYARSTPVRLVRADPYLFAPPHKIDGITLASARLFDYFGDGINASSQDFGKPLSLRQRS
jgi:hypothetical protein